MGRLVDWMDRRFYPGAGPNWDDEVFRARILGHVTRETRMLDLGAGAGIVPQMNFRGLAKSVVGVDPDPRVVVNPHLDEGRVGVGEALPTDDASVDVVIADNVLEHLEAPGRVFAEVARVLRPGGRFLAKTPNAWHYMPLIARLTPTAFHRAYNRIRGRPAADTFRTRYLANTRRDLTRLAAAAGLELAAFERLEGRPEYLRLSSPTYLGGLVYERLVNRFDALERFRIVLIATFRKPA